MRNLRRSVLLLAVSATLLTGPFLGTVQATAPAGTFHIAPVGCTNGATSVQTVSFRGTVGGLVPAATYVVWLAPTNPASYPLASRQGADRWIVATDQGGLAFDYPTLAGANTQAGWPVGVSYTISVDMVLADGTVGPSVVSTAAPMASCPAAPVAPPVAPKPPPPPAPAKAPALPAPAKPPAPPAQPAPILRQSGNDTAALHEQCAALMFLGVRGSNEHSSEGGGYGNEVWYVRNGVLSEIPATAKFREVYIDYESQAVGTLIASMPGPDNTFFTSVHEGQAKLENVLNDSIARCPNEKWILAGYSQGALIVNRVVRNFTLDERIVGIGLIADPARRPDQVGVQVGTATPWWGVAHAASPLPAVFNRLSTINACNKNDIVCDFTADPFGIAVHTSYATKQSLLLVTVGKALISRSGLPTNSSLNTTGSAAVATFSASDVRAGQSASVRLQGLPPGAPVNVAIHSQNIDMGSVNATPEGTLDYTFTVPAGLDVGAHEIVFVTGYGDVSVPFTVTVAPTGTPAARLTPSASTTCGEEGQSDASSARCLALSGTDAHIAPSSSTVWGLRAIGVGVACGALVLGIAYRRRRHNR